MRYNTERSAGGAASLTAISQCKDTVCDLNETWHRSLIQLKATGMEKRLHTQAFNQSHLLSCFCSRSRRVSSWLRCCRLRLCSGVLRGGGDAKLQLGTSWYWPPPRLSPQKLKMWDTPENAPVGEETGGGGEWVCLRRHYCIIHMDMEILVCTWQGVAGVPSLGVSISLSVLVEAPGHGLSLRVLQHRRWRGQSGHNWLLPL